MLTPLRLAQQANAVFKGRHPPKKLLKQYLDACRKGNATSLATLLSQQPKCVRWRKPDTGQTGLHIALEYGHRTLVSMLVNKGADIEATDALGRTPLLIAARTCPASVFMFLIEQGADITHRDDKGLTVVDVALKSNQGTDVLSTIRAYAQAHDIAQFKQGLACPLTLSHPRLSLRPPQR